MDGVFGKVCGGLVAGTAGGVGEGPGGCDVTGLRGAAHAGVGKRSCRRRRLLKAASLT